MNNCTKFEDLCSLCVDGQLTDAEETELMNHLQECSACAEYLEELKTIKNEFEQLDTAIPDTLHETIMTAVCQEAASRTVQYRQPKRRAPMFTMIGAAAAAVIMVTSGALGDIVNKNHSVVEPKEEAAAEKSDTAAPQTADVSPELFVADSKIQTAGSEAEGADDASGGGGGASSEAMPKAASRAMTAAPDTNKQEKSAAPEMAIAAAPPEDNGSSYGSTSNATEKIVIPASIAAESYAFCVVARGTEKMPEIDGTLVSGEIGGSQAFFTVSNSMTFLEKLMESLSKAGYEPQIDKSALVAQDKKADTGLVILIKD